MSSETEDHKHELAWSYEGPLWFCACGAEFYPKKASITVPVLVPRLRMRLRYGTHAIFPK